jgi:hypothetical protein
MPLQVSFLFVLCKNRVFGKPNNLTKVNLVYMHNMLLQKHMKKLLSLLSCCVLLLIGCKEEDAFIPEPVKINTIPAFYTPQVEETVYGKNTPELQLIANGLNLVQNPWDLDFHPTRDKELWIINKGAANTGGSTVTIFNAGKSNQSTRWLRDGNAYHFMSLPSAISFSADNGNFATTADVQDANHSGGTFTGPTLWSSDLNIYSRPSGGNGSHLDMLHGSPFSMGIEWDSGNAFWVFDGYNEDIVFYDFVDDHGPGNDYHGDGRVHRYSELGIKRMDESPSHMVMDRKTHWLYLVDAGNQRVLRMDTKSGGKFTSLPLINEELAEHFEVEGVTWEILSTPNVQQPAGIEISGRILYLSDVESGDIIAYDIDSFKELARFNTGKKGVMGLKADKQGHLWFVASGTSEVYKIIPK